MPKSNIQSIPMAKVPSHLQSAAQQYVNLTKETISNLDFLHDNLGVEVSLDLFPESIRLMELQLKGFHEHENPDELWPKLIDTYAQLLSQYGALVNLELCHANWDIDSQKSSFYFGQPFVDVVPTEPWRRYHPIHFQVVLRRPEIFSSSSKFRPLSKQAQDNRKARATYDKLLTRIADLIEASPARGLIEPEVVKGLEDLELAPPKKRFGVANKSFPKRVGAILRKSGVFSLRRSDKTWRIKRGIDIASLPNHF